MQNTHDLLVGTISIGIPSCNVEGVLALCISNGATMISGLFYVR